jgi:hypothetical protein
MRINVVNLRIKPARIRVQFDNLFNGQKALEQVANEAINQNVNLITDDVIPQIERAVEQKILKAANQVFERAPAAEFFP